MRSTHCGIVVLSPDFFRKEWPQRELEALLSREEDGARVVPILHNLSRKELRIQNPDLAGLISLDTKDGIQSIASDLAVVAERDWNFQPLYRAGEYKATIEFPFDALEDAVSAIDRFLAPEFWRRLSATEDVSRPRTWMGSKDDLMVAAGFEIFRPMLIFADREDTLERGVANYDDISHITFGALRLSFETRTREYELARPHLLARDYTPRTTNWRQLRERNPAKYLWQGLGRREISAVLEILRELERDVADVSTEQFARKYNEIFDTRCKGYKQIGLLFNAIYRFEPVNRPIFVSLLVLFRILWGATLEAAADHRKRKSFGDLFDNEVIKVSNQVDTWPEHQQTALQAHTFAALRRYAVSRMPEAFAQPRSDLNKTET